MVTPHKVATRWMLHQLHQAAYSEDFLQWANGRKHLHPATRREVQFGSLPGDEKTKLHSQWARAQEAQTSEPESEEEHDIPDFYESQLTEHPPSEEDKANAGKFSPDVHHGLSTLDPHEEADPKVLKKLRTLGLVHPHSQERTDLGVSVLRGLYGDDALDPF